MRTFLTRNDERARRRARHEVIASLADAISEVLTCVFLFVMLFYGLPIIANIIGGFLK